MVIVIAIGQCSYFIFLERSLGLLLSDSYSVLFVFRTYLFCFVFRIYSIIVFFFYENTA